MYYLKEAVRRLIRYILSAVLRLPHPHPEMPVEDLIRLLDLPAPWIMPRGWQLWPVSAKAHRIMARRFIANMPSYPGGFEGRGIVICAGGTRYFTCAYVCARMLRLLGCQLPIQFWHLGKREMDDRMRAIAAELGAVCIDAIKVKKHHPARMLYGWPLKPFALLHCSFKEVLLIDADNVPVVDPSYLFELNEFKNSGAVFWPDRECLAPDRSIWDICDVSFRDEPEIESGQILIDKEIVWPALLLSMWMNEHADYYYTHIHGDKCTYQMAWHMLNQAYEMPPTRMKAIDATMCQHDFSGRRVFQHRAWDKWRLDGSNKRITGFLYEDQCRAMLGDLRLRWSGVVGH